MEVEETARTKQSMLETIQKERNMTPDVDISLSGDTPLVIPSLQVSVTMEKVKSGSLSHGRHTTEDLEYQRIKVTKISDEVGEETAQACRDFLKIIDKRRYYLYTKPVKYYGHTHPEAHAPRSAAEGPKRKVTKQDVSYHKRESMVTEKERPAVSRDGHSRFRL